MDHRCDTLIESMILHRRIKNEQIEHRHCRRIAAAILGCADKHRVALLLDNRKEEAHGTSERCSLAEYHNKKVDVDGADQFCLFELHQGTIC